MGTGSLHSSFLLKPTGFSGRLLCLPSPLTLGRASEKSVIEAEALQDWPSPCCGLLSMSPLRDHVWVYLLFQNFSDVPLYLLLKNVQCIGSGPLLSKGAFETEVLTESLGQEAHVCGFLGGSEGPLGTAEDSAQPSRPVDTLCPTVRRSPADRLPEPRGPSACFWLFLSSHWRCGERRDCRVHT